MAGRVNLPSVPPRRAAPALLLVALLAPVPSVAQVKEEKRLAACQEVLEELLGGEERVPRDLMNPKGIDYLMRSQFTLGGDAAVAAGPVGRTGSAGTDLRMRAEILSYSRTRGLFAGISLEGSVVKQDKDGNSRVYGERVDPRRLLIEGTYPVPAAARGLVELLATSSPRRGPEG